MKSEFRLVGRHTLIYGVGALLGNVTGFLMLPVYTRFLTPSDYGVLELLGMTIEVIGTVAGVGIAGALFKFYSDVEGSEAQRQVVGTAAIGATGLALGTSVAGLVAAPLLTHLIFQGPENTGLLRIVFLAYFFQAAAGPGLLLLRIQERSGAFVGLSLAKLVSALGLNIYFVVFRQMGVRGVLLSSLITSAAVAVVLAFYTYRYAGMRFSMPRFREMTRFGAPLIVVSLGSFVLAFSDRFFLNHFSGTAEVGVYSLAYRFAFVLSSLAVVPFQQIWEPRRFEVAKRPDAHDIFQRMFFYLTGFLVVGAGIILVVIDDVLHIMAAPAFHPAAGLVPVILIATVLQQWANYCSLGLYLKDQTETLARATLAAVLAALVLNALLIPRWGGMGAGWATVAAYSVRFGVVYFSAQALYPIPFPWGRVAGVVGIAAGGYLVRAVVEPQGLVMSMALGSALCVTIIMAAYYMLDEGERRVTRELIRRAMVWARKRA